MFHLSEERRICERFWKNVKIILSMDNMRHDQEKKYIYEENDGRNIEKCT